MPVISNQMFWDSVGIPLVSGIDVNTRARLVSPDKLLRAENVSYPRNGGPQKRTGHTGFNVLDSAATLMNDSGTSAIFGYGKYLTESVLANADTDCAEESGFPQADQIRGVATRDQEQLAWDGYRMYSRTEAGFTRPQKYVAAADVSRPANLTTNSTAVFPVAKTETIAKTQNAQSYSVGADNGVIRVVAYRDLAATDVKLSCYDSATGALKFTSTLAVTDPEYLKIVPVGAYIHILANDLSGTELKRFTIPEFATSFSGAVSGTLGVLTNSIFAVHKISEELFLVGKKDGSDAKITYLNANGSTNTTYCSGNTILDTGGVIPLDLVLAVHPISGDICMVWENVGAQATYRIYTQFGVPKTTALLVTTMPAAVNKLALVSSALLTTTGKSKFYAYICCNGATDLLESYSLTESPSAPFKIGERHNVNLVSEAWRIGNSPYIIACYFSPLQTTYLILDRSLRPVGKLEYGSAVNNIADPSPSTFSVNWTSTNPYHVHGCILYKTRVLEQDGVFHETSTKWLSVDFLPKLRSVQAGRCTYFAGAQLWQYDGEELVEAGFHFAPENITYTVSNGPGSLTLLGTYQYRVYLCHKNAQGEEVRSPAILSPDVTLIGAEDTITLTIGTIPTCRENSYFLVYRREATGTLWYLVSDRDPSSANCPKNTLNQRDVSFQDVTSDALLLNKELDPANAPGYLHQFSAPANDTVAFGKNRLWVSGGEMSPGDVLPSRLFFAGETPGFNLQLGVTVDSVDTPVTGIGFIADYAVVFKANSGYLLSGDVADNVSVGGNLGVQLILSEVGCVSQESLARITTGLVFQSAGGYRLVDASGSLRNIGDPVNPLATACVGAVVSYLDRQVRFYQSEGQSLVWDFESGEWSTWSILPSSACISGELALLGYTDKLLLETPELYTDDGANYTYAVKTAHLAQKLGSFQRVRRFEYLGEPDPWDGQVVINVYRDESDTPSEVHDWQPSLDLNVSVWGSDTWGLGAWGDVAVNPPAFMQDSIWRLRKRLSVQKCSSISVELMYNGPDRGPVPTALVLEIGQKGGLNRINSSSAGSPGGIVIGPS